MKSIRIHLFALVSTLFLANCSMTQSQWDAARVCGANPNDPMCDYHQRQARDERESTREQEATRERLDNEATALRNIELQSQKLQREKLEEEARKWHEENLVKWNETISHLKTTETSAAKEKFPHLAWMNGFWCTPMTSQFRWPEGLPAVYWEIQENGNLRVVHSGADYIKGQYIEQVGTNYYDLYTARTKSTDNGPAGKDTVITRYEKRSDDQFILVDQRLEFLKHEQFPTSAAILAHLKRRSSEMTVRENVSFRRTFDRCE